MKSLPVAYYDRIDKLLDDGVLAWVVAINLTDGTSFYLTTNDKHLVYAGQTWEPFPMKIGEQPDSGEGNLVSSTLTLSNVGRIPMPFLEREVWDQAVVELQIVFVPLLTTQLGLSAVTRIQSATATHEAVTLNLGRPNWAARPYPVSKFIAAERFPGIPRNAN